MPDTGRPGLPNQPAGAPLELICLGVGSSTGTPVIGCDCAVCASADPRNRRTRTSLAVRLDSGATLLVDTGPDLRLQALREGLTRVDAVLYTHTHADHVHGIDDLRNFCALQKTVIPVYGNDIAVRDLRARFSYAFLPPKNWDRPALAAAVADGPFCVAGTVVTPVPLWHGRLPACGWRVGDAAWLTDVSEIPPEGLARLQGLKVLMINCLRDRPHPAHLDVERAVVYAHALGAERTYLIHMTHDLDYARLAAELPPGVAPAHDGLRVAL